jgi:hypothetical protein
MNKSKISIESEEFMVSRLVYNLTERMTEELNQSLKQQAKNKYFDVLVEKTNKLFDEIILKSSLSQKSKVKLSQHLSNLNIILKRLYLNKI